MGIYLVNKPLGKTSFDADAGPSLTSAQVEVPAVCDYGRILTMAESTRKQQDSSRDLLEELEDGWASPAGAR